MVPITMFIRALCEEKVEKPPGLMEVIKYDYCIGHFTQFFCDKKSMAMREWPSWDMPLISTTF